MNAPAALPISDKKSIKFHGVRCKIAYKTQNMGW